jgi:hypothetical protein
MSYLKNYREWSRVFEATKGIEACCSAPKVSPDKVKEYWADGSKTPEEKKKEMTDWAGLLFKKAKTYYLGYVAGEFFQKKIKEKIDLSIKGPEDLETLGFDASGWNLEGGEFFNRWQTSPKGKLDGFIRGMKMEVVTGEYPDPDPRSRCKSAKGFVQSGNPRKIYLCAQYYYPDPDSDMGPLYQVIVHEMKHAINFFCRGQLGISAFLPEDLKGAETSLPGLNDLQYGNRSDENSARVQNLRLLLGVDNWESVEALSGLLSSGLQILEGDQPCQIQYEGQVMKIYTQADPGSLLNLTLKIKGKTNADIRFLFNAFARNQKGPDGKSWIEVDLSSLFNYTQQLAKTGKAQDLNVA